MPASGEPLVSGVCADPAGLQPAEEFIGVGPEGSPQCKSLHLESPFGISQVISPLWGWISFLVCISDCQSWCSLGRMKEGGGGKALVGSVKESEATETGRM